MNVTRTLLKDLETNRNSKIISMVYADGAYMNDDDVDIVNDMLDDLCEGKKVDKIEMILSSLGGDANAAFLIVKSVRRYCDEFNIIIPRRAKSAASLLALGADKIFMGKISELGPIDPLVNHPLLTETMIPARCVPYFSEKVLPQIAKMGVEDYFLKVDYAHVAFCMMSVELTRDYAKRLLVSFHFKGQDDKIRSVDDLVKKLTEYPSHDFVIDINEVKNLGLNVEELSAEDWKLLQSLYKEYKENLNEIGMIVETSKNKFEIKIKKLKPTFW